MLPATGDGADLPDGGMIAVKEAVLPFGRFHGVDTVLGPEMSSTGEVMGIDASSAPRSPSPRSPPTPRACPPAGRVFVSVANRDKRSMIFPVKRLADLGFEILATEGTADVLRRNGVKATVVRKNHEAGEGLNTVEAILGGHIDLIVNTPYGVGPRLDGYEIRTAAVVRGVPCITTVQGLAAAVQGIEALHRGRARGPVAAGARRRARALRRTQP